MTGVPYSSYWRVCWLGGWDKQRVFFVVMLVRVKH